MTSASRELVLNRTCFYDFHCQSGAKIVDFFGWEMPVMYRSVHEEHRQVRSYGGVFDVSHMGRLRLSGGGARRLLERVLTRRIGDMAPSTCRYSLVCNEQGGTLDDVIVYRFDDHWLLVVNASNREKIVAHLELQQGGAVGVTIEDQTMSTGMVAVQGPEVMRIIGDFSTEIPTLKRYAFCVKDLLVLKLIVSRTGYTGEDGVEVIVGAKMAETVLKLLMPDRGEGDASRLAPVGLGARDSLRLEAGMPLYGHELDEQTDPISAGLSFAVSFDKKDQDGGEPFIGQAALESVAASPQRRLVGLKLDGRRTARQSMPVLIGERQVGAVTSGCVSPTLEVPIAMAYVQVDDSAESTDVDIDMGRGRVAAQIVPLPFYRRGSREQGAGSA
ncbi:MAG: glycine cleavage system protein T [Phycisphaeraceae bacterium]|nr:glycine cleavage system protein T [Phycisphaeraceae bacterium]